MGRNQICQSKYKVRTSQTTRVVQKDFFKAPKTFKIDHVEFFCWFEPPYSTSPRLIYDVGLVSNFIEPFLVNICSSQTNDNH